MFHHLHAVVEDAGQFQHFCAAAQGLRKLLRRDLAVRQQHNGLEGSAHIGGIERGGGGGVARGSADREHFFPVVAAAQPFQIAEGTGHAPVLEGGAGILAVVLVSKGDADLIPEGGSGFDDGRKAFAKIDNVFFIHQRGQQLIIAENAAQSRGARCGAFVKNGAPLLTAGGAQGIETGVFQQEDAAAVRAGVEQRVAGTARPAAEADVLHFTSVGREIFVAHRKLLERKRVGEALPAEKRRRCPHASFF